jgi:hypothetical protein
MKPMTKYIVKWRELVYYEVEVEADSPDEAITLADEQSDPLSHIYEHETVGQPCVTLNPEQ